LEGAYQPKAQTTRVQNKKDALTRRTHIAPHVRKQAANLQNCVDTHMDLRHRAVGCASKTNIAILKSYQSKLLRIITNAPRYVANQILHTDLRIQYMQAIRDEYNKKHRSTLEHHPNPVVKPLLLHNHPTR
jgi:hypothetical protein